MPEPEVIDMGDFSLDGDTTQQPQPPAEAEPYNAPTNLKPPSIKEKQITNKQISQVLGAQSDEDIKQHQEHVIMLSRYGSSPRFGEYLLSLCIDLKVSKLKKLSLAELKELLARVRTSIANKTVSDVWSDSIIGAMDLGEKAVAMTRLGESIRINGLSECLKTDETFLDLLEELKLENQNLSYVSPYVRIVYTVLTASAKCHGMNTMLHNHKEKQKQKQKQKPVIVQEQPTTDETKIITTKKKKVNPEDHVIEM